MINGLFREDGLADMSIMPLVERRIKFYLLLGLQIPSLLCTAFM